MNTENKIHIYPVIEISPWQVDSNDSLSIKEGQGYTDFALEVFRNNGIKNITRLDAFAYSSIIISDIDDADLKVIIEKELDDAEISEIGTETVGPFCGGLVLNLGHQNIIHHQCCGSISDYKNWNSFIDESPSNWTEIWIGHPWIYARVKDDRIEFSDYTELTGPLDESTVKVKTSVDINEFRNQLKSANVELMKFKTHILKVLTAEMKGVAAEVTEILVENEYNDD
jgi:hypothetical protein